MKTRLLTIAGAVLTAALTTACPSGQQTTEQTEQQTTEESPEPIRVGAYEVYVLQETLGTGNTDILIDAPEEVLTQYAPDGTYPTATNAVLVRRGDRVWLIDTGFGRTIFDRMASLGIVPEDVDEVLLTHMHGDHIGGMLREGVKAFPNATVLLAEREFDHWSGIGNEAAMNIFSEYGDAVRKLSPVEIDAPVQDGITPIAAYGHTPGHTVFMLKDGDEQLLVWGDVAHAMAVQMPHPEISVRYDTDPAAARESRLKVLRHVAEAGIPVVGMHIPATMTGKVHANGDGYEFSVESSE